MSFYNHKEIEPKWQKYWADHHTFKTGTDASKPKFYALDMFPYPSGAGLHVGHPEGYTATDILSRFKRAQGYNVLHPMGWDAFGLPAEQYAMDTGNDPAEFTAENIANFKRQINALGFSYDWDREVNTTDPNYYKWTQWIFTKLYEKGLAYEAEVPVNWVEELGTAIANEEVLPDGTSERGGYPVVRKPMRQWMLKITAYAERLLNDLDDLDWPESIKDMQRNWIGKSTGANVTFKVKGTDKEFTVFTTRPDTLFGATFTVLAPEHDLVDAITTPEQAEAVADYKHQASLKSDLARTDLAKEKTGVWTGAYAINPVNGKEIPIWIADYVLASYGTGAVMAVPAHDERDWEFETIGNWDKFLLNRAFMNIVSNAVEHTPSGSQLLLTARVEDDEFKFICLDSGPGFSLESLEKATQLFYQEDKSRQSRNHSGLGLTIANDIIRLHHGSLSLSNDNGTGGARVTIILPL